ncbi:hypothetical protein G7K_2246-t1 [Saitoella complicata NRRL Y-17804]|uniref:Uncharacterized protein n=1 Tax=Saitoella complicata (strain BCRC 22490 / CBS 7301 / JCM 7358 / NBRC 10748 / NRRL Y-17804) TaxID=698492 RepID=A0A0E9NE24_SAICN|nr:hypothetical protein G7K_2246-t1 [Saitoella complicata NRRL Y-17804]
MSGGPSAEAVTAGIALTTLEDLRGERFLVRNVFATIRRRATIRRESFHIARERWKILVGHQFPLASRTAPRAHAPVDQTTINAQSPQDTLSQHIIASSHTRQNPGNLNQSQTKPNTASTYPLPSTSMESTPGQISPPREE